MACVSDLLWRRVCMQDYWKKCNVCKKEIPFNTAYQVCSVSTCQNSRTGFTFCSVECWDAHLGVVKHRDSWAEERYSPRKEESPVSPTNPGPPPQRRYVTAPAMETSRPAPEIMTDTLVVVSKVKKLINEQSSFNTSQCAIDALTEKVVKECLRAIESARASGRKTVMGRDF